MLRITKFSSRLARLVGLIVFCALVSCKGRSVNPEQEMGPPEPPANETESSEPLGPEPPVGPMPTEDYTPPKEGVVLVLGPGLVHDLSYVGVLKELQQKNIPIQAVVGVEMGALISAIWSSSNLNTLEWEIHKFKKKTLLSKSLFGISKRVSDGKALIRFINEAIKAEKLEDLKKIPVLVASIVRQGGDEGDRELVVERSGDIKQIVRGAMSIPGVLEPIEWNGTRRSSAGQEYPFPTNEAKNLELGKVVCVDAISIGFRGTSTDVTEEQVNTIMRATGAVAKPMLKDCDSVISVDLSRYSFLSFESKADMIYAGKVAVRTWLNKNQ